MLISVFFNKLRFSNFELFENLISLFNWLPFFWIFWGYQVYLNTLEKRKECMKFFLIGSFPIIIGGFLQYFFKIYGPFFFLGTWFQRNMCTGKLEREECVTGITSVFSNPNYYSSWLMLIFSIAIGYSIYLSKKNSRLKYLSIFYALSILLSSVLTSSRNAWLGIVFTLIFFFYRKKNKIIFFSINVLISLILFFCLFAYLSENALFLSLIYKLSKSDLNNSLINFLSYTRINLWFNSIRLILENPLFGSGILSVSSLKISNMTHAHNIFLETSIVYGLLSSILLLANIVNISYKSFQKVFLKNSFFKRDNLSIIDKSWFISFSALFLTNIFDLPYYDVKISLSMWVMLAGLRSLINSNQESKLIENKNI